MTIERLQTIVKVSDDLIAVNDAYLERKFSDARYSATIRVLVSKLKEAERIDENIRSTFSYGSILAAFRPILMDDVVLSESSDVM